MRAGLSCAPRRRLDGAGVCEETEQTPSSGWAPAGAHVRTPSVPIPGRTDRWKDGLHKLIPVRFQSVRDGDTECGRGKEVRVRTASCPRPPWGHREGTRLPRSVRQRCPAWISGAGGAARHIQGQTFRLCTAVPTVQGSRGDATVNSECPRMVQTLQRDRPPGRVRVWAGPPSPACGPLWWHPRQCSETRGAGAEQKRSSGAATCSATAAGPRSDLLVHTHVSGPPGRSLCPRGILGTQSFRGMATL